MRSLPYLIAAASLALVAACSGSETGNPFVGDLSTDTHSSDPDQVDVAQSQGVTVSQAWVVQQPVRFHQASDCDTGDGVAIALAVGAVDHAADDDQRVALELDPDTYCRIAVALELAAAPLPASAPADLEGHSVLVTGTTASGTPFRIASQALMQADVRSMAGTFDIDGDTPSLFLGMDVNTWLGSLDLDSGAVNGDGVIVIDDGNNSALLSAFEALFPTGIELFRDFNGSGSVDEASDTLIARGVAP